MKIEGMGGVELSKVEEERASELHKRAIIVDGLAIKPIHLDEPKYFDELVKGGVTAANFCTAGIEWDRPLADFLSSVKETESAIKKVEDNPDKMLLVTQADDVRRAKREGKVGVIIGFQDGKPIENQIAYLRIFHRLGVRIMMLVENEQNMIGGGCAELVDPGLTFYGKEVLAEMNRIGMLVDLCHCGDRTKMEAIELSKDPVIFSHINPRSFCNTPRNATDEAMKALAEKGGVMGLSLWPVLMRLDYAKGGMPTLKDLMDQVDYTVDLMGVDHVGFGWDTNEKTMDVEGLVSYIVERWRKLRPGLYGYNWPKSCEGGPVGAERRSKYINITRALVSRGYSDQEIEKLLGGNFLRIFQRVWK
jgi:membrane dipeptidase